jgi:hypothetical protein
MKCNTCQQEMIKGAISTAGKADTMWYSREPLLKSMLGHNLIAWCCEKCGKVELTTDVQDHQEK